MKKILFILVLCISFLGYSQNNDLFKKATEAYNDGKYDTAIKDYLAIIDNGKHSAELYYNLGNAYYKLNKVAPSIYYYEKALLLKPNDPEIKNNLGYAKNMTLDVINPLPVTTLRSTYNKVIGYYTFDEWAYISILFMLLFVVAYIAFKFFNYATQKRISFIASTTFLFLSILAITAAYFNYSDFKKNRPAIVFNEESLVIGEPNSRGKEVFKLHQGTKVFVLDQLKNYYKIKLIDGKTGWIEQEDLKELK
ncbi:tetratricopeptide repeat protein [Cellulophaga sp. 20_2_10]|uniref:tetratricopeptide repeat protein n=1 Tax=Cellulophaga sp. 20_2_10 TaxID=2942476 RepID=UPI00201A4656|nr:tetratricopeptide repeat protein [Cellulophaga sp. 20_2_10]MCL5246363.1 tetratricopeptide repeat protein [Cellulophaga sp. 20_2_10]